MIDEPNILDEIKKSEHLLKDLVKESPTLNIGIHEDNLIVSGTKIASTWTASLIYKYVNDNIDNTISERQCRRLGHISVEENKLQFESKGTDTKAKYHSHLKNKYNNIFNSPDNRLFILIRHPVTRYVQSLKQDLFVHFNKHNSQTIEEFILENLKNTKLIEDTLKKMLELVFKDSDTFPWYIGGIRTPHYTSYYSSVFNLISELDKRYISILDIDNDNISNKIIPGTDNLKANKTEDVIKMFFNKVVIDTITNKEYVLREITSLLSSDIAIYNKLKKFG